MTEGRGSATPWAFQVGKLLGIPIRVHWTFVLLVAWVGMLVGGGDRFLVGVVLTLLLFGCVACHEVGHAIVARKFRVKTHEIVLYPVGGIAKRETAPSGLPDLAIAVAGPLVNLGLALIMLPTMAIFGSPPESLGLDPASIAKFLFFGNLGLFFFNLVPAFPMDGGRILRATLALGLPTEQANRSATLIGQGCALLLGIVGAFSPFPIEMMLVALLVFVGASQEAMVHRRQGVLEGRTVSEAMMTRFERLAPQEPLRRAVQLLLNTPQQDFPVVDVWGRAAGIVTRNTVLAGLGRLGPDAAILDVMDRSPHVISPEESLGVLFGQMQGLPGGPILVADEERGLVGMISSDSVARFVAVIAQLSSEQTTPEA